MERLTFQLRLKWRHVECIVHCLEIPGSGCKARDMRHQSPHALGYNIHEQGRLFIDYTRLPVIHTDRYVRLSARASERCVGHSKQKRPPILVHSASSMPRTWVRIPYHRTAPHATRLNTILAVSYADPHLDVISMQFSQDNSSSQ